MTKRIDRLPHSIQLKRNILHRIRHVPTEHSRAHFLNKPRAVRQRNRINDSNFFFWQSGNVTPQQERALQYFLYRYSICWTSMTDLTPGESGGNDVMRLSRVRSPVWAFLFSSYTWGVALMAAARFRHKACCSPPASPAIRWNYE